MMQGRNAATAIDAAVARFIRRLTGLLLGLAAVLIIEAAPAATAPELQNVGGPRLLLAAGEGPRVDALMLDSRLDLRISGLLAKATLEQRFRNPGSEWREAEYLLPLPEDAAVRSMEMRIGDRRIVGEIREREVARQVYDAARRAGKRSALLEQQRPNLFTTRVANVAPQAEVVLRIELLLPVSYLDGQFSLRFPTTLTAAYVPGSPLGNALPADEIMAGRPTADSWLNLDGSGWAVSTNQVTDAPLISAPQYARDGNDRQPLNPLHIDVSLDPGLELAEVAALYHDLSIRRSGNRYELALRHGVAEMNRDFVLNWRPVAEALPQAALFREDFDGESFALLMLLPPQHRSAQHRLPRELLLVLDVSGSMQGEPIRQARASVLHALETLGPDDRVNLLLFNDGMRQIFPGPKPATDTVLRELRSIVSRISADGGTEMLPALRAALRMPRSESGAQEGASLRQILFITDGAVANEDALLSLIDAELEDARIYTVAIGSAPNGYFMRRAAELGRGEALFIAQATEVAPQLDALFRRIATPMASDLRVDWPQRVEAFPARIPDLYAGQPLLQAVRLHSGSSSGTIRVTGSLSEQSWTRQLSLQGARPAPGVAAHWARRKQASLLDGLLRGESRETVRAAVLPLALRFSLASPFTSFVAREQVRARPAAATSVPAKIPNTRPQGQAAQRFAFPQSATTAAAKLYLGLLCAFAALVGWAMTRREVD